MLNRYRLFRAFLAPIQFVCLTSCATDPTTTIDYSTPAVPELRNTAVVEEPFTIVWDRLVGRLAESFFVINNVEKESRIINLTFSSTTPSSYVDCGKVRRTFQFSGESSQYDYGIAEASSFKIGAGRWGEYKNLPAVAIVERAVRLEGRLNIYVAPQETRTLVSANAKYLLSEDLRQTMEFYNAFGVLMNSQPGTQATHSVAFSTKESGSELWDGTYVACRSKGVLEATILEMVSP